MKKWIDRLIWKSHCLLFGHKWADDGLCKADGWVSQTCECGKKRMYNIITHEETDYPNLKTVF